MNNKVKTCIPEDTQVRVYATNNTQVYHRVTFSGIPGKQHQTFSIPPMPDYQLITTLSVDQPAGTFSNPNNTANSYWLEITIERSTHGPWHNINWLENRIEIGNITAARGLIEEIVRSDSGQQKLIDPDTRYWDDVTLKLHYSSTQAKPCSGQQTSEASSKTAAEDLSNS